MEESRSSANFFFPVCFLSVEASVEGSCLGCNGCINLDSDWLVLGVWDRVEDRLLALVSDAL